MLWPSSRVIPYNWWAMYSTPLPSVPLNMSNSAPPVLWLPFDLSPPKALSTLHDLSDSAPLVLQSSGNLSPPEALSSPPGVLSDVSNCTHPLCWLPAGHGGSPASLQRIINSAPLHPNMSGSTRTSWPDTKFLVSSCTTVIKNKIKTAVSLYATLHLPELSNYNKKLSPALALLPTYLILPTCPSFP